MLKVLIIASLCGLSLNSYAKTAVENGSKKTEKSIEMTVYRSPSCSCCGKWIEHVKKNNFNVKDVLTQDMQAIKNKHGVSQKMASCHTAIVDGYVVEGHVPAHDIKALLNMKPKIVGISVPGMPVGTPGMEMNGKADAYDVVGFDKNNQYQIFKHYKAK
ncbi:MAG: DUF411 domain-containing protein [Methylococcales bacterium]|nr:DUF411 domain-containing protein [Methylococcales bacterium]